MNQTFYGWRLLFCLFLILVFTTGVLSYGASVLITSMMMELQLDRESLGFAISSYGIVLGLTAPLAGILIHRWGAKKSMIAGMLLLILGSLAMATVVNSLPALMVAYGLIMGCGAALGSTIPAQTLVSYWFKKRLALAMTLAMIGTNVGGAIAAPLFGYVLAVSGGNWKLGWFLVAASCAISFFIALFFVKNQPEDIGQQVDGGMGATADANGHIDKPSSTKLYKTEEEWEFGEMIRHPVAWWMVVGVLCGTVDIGIVVGHGVAHFLDLGFSQAMSANFLGIMLGFGVLGRIIYAAIGDYIEPRFVWSLALIMLSGGMLVMTNASSELGLYMTALLLGLGSSFPILCFSAMAVNYFGRKVFCRFMGVLMLFMSLVPAAMIIITGMVFDRMGSYAAAFYTAAVVFVAVGVVLPFVRPPKHSSELLVGLEEAANG